MELRVLKYFLTAVQEGSITNAAKSLHLTQPTLSRQLIELEEELGVTLFKRGGRQLTLTDDGMLLKQRASELLSLAEKTKREFTEQKELVGGMISIGSVESTAMRLLPILLENFLKKYPRVQYDLYSGTGDDIKEKIDKGLIDVGFLTEPADIGEYEYYRLPMKDRWGVLMRKDDPLADRHFVTMDQIAGLPLILPWRDLLQKEIAGWGEGMKSPNVFATYHLLLSAVLMVERGMGYAICLDGAGAVRSDTDTCFVPLKPARVAGNLTIWRKNRIFNPATSLFIDFIKKESPSIQQSEKNKNTVDISLY